MRNCFDFVVCLHTIYMINIDIAVTSSQQQLNSIEILANFIYIMINDQESDNNVI